MNTKMDRESALQAVRKWVAGEMEHPYLINFIPIPNLEEFQLRMAFAILQAAKVSKDELETVLTTLLLIYHGLAIHEQIEETSNNSDSRYLQLSVLAGDYYSSKYFFLLAKAGYVHLIGKLAKAITVINEAKVARTSLAERGGSAQEYIDVTTTIVSELLLTLVESYGLPDTWEPCILDACRTMVVHEEMNLLSTGVYRGFGYHYLSGKCTSSERVLLESSIGLSRIMPLHIKYGTLRDLGELLASSYHRTIEQVSLVASGVSLDFVMRAVEKFARYVPERRTVEEG